MNIFDSRFNSIYQKSLKGTFKPVFEFKITLEFVF